MIGTSEIIVRPGLINVDFADVREVVKNSGTALIGIGTGTGKVREPRLRLVASACCLYPPLMLTAHFCAVYSILRVGCTRVSSIIAKGGGAESEDSISAAAVAAEM